MAKATKPTSPSSKATDASKATPEIEDAVVLGSDADPEAKPKAAKSKPASKAAASSETVKKPEPASNQAKPIAAAMPKVEKPRPAKDTPTDDVSKQNVQKKDASLSQSSSSSRAEMVHPVPAPIEPEKRESIFWPLLLGGAIAAVAGFVASELDLFDNRGDAITTQLRADLASQQERLSAVEERAPSEVDLSSIDDLKTDVTSQIADVSEQLSKVNTRLAALESLPPLADLGAEAAAAYASELTTLKASVEDQRAEIAGLLDNARSVKEATADSAKAATAQAALARIMLAIDAGQPFLEPLTELQSVEVGDIPQALSDSAGDGVVTMADLQQSFPDLARAALAAARANDQDESAQGIGGFLKRQLGARSVLPREGSDPDAVLSRAEAALRNGNLPDTIAEIEALPEEAKTEMADWLAGAQARSNAQAAADALAQRLTAN
ncbi:COG4223 family protein [Sulfitobacter sp. SK012]|uniref:COG4223 family protein n=1 Tax=Sulfitobacter sp. SK012 TaxID=1389005 RepID=UPI0013B414F8|nr:hypothetical protein [Sulfitobacter sp. SK012]